LSSIEFNPTIGTNNSQKSVPKPSINYYEPPQTPSKALSVANKPSSGISSAEKRFKSRLGQTPTAGSGSKLNNLRNKLESIKWSSSKKQPKEEVSTNKQTESYLFKSKMKRSQSWDPKLGKLVFSK